MSEYEKFIKNAQRIIRNETMKLQDTKFAGHFNVPLYRLIWQVLIAIIGIVALYYTLIGNVSMNAQNINTNKNDIIEHKVIFDKHIEDVRNNPISDAEMELTVAGNTANIKLNTAETKRISDLQIGVVTKQGDIVDDVSDIKDDMDEMQKDVSTINANVQILLDRTVKRYDNNNQ